MTYESESNINRGPSFSREVARRNRMTCEYGQVMTIQSRSVIDEIGGEYPMAGRKAALSLLQNSKTMTEPTEIIAVDQKVPHQERR